MRESEGVVGRREAKRRTRGAKRLENRSVWTKSG